MIISGTNKRIDALGTTPYPEIRGTSDDEIPASTIETLESLERPKPFGRTFVFDGQRLFVAIGALTLGK